MIKKTILSKRQAQCLRIIRQHQKAGLGSPFMSEIAESMKCSRERARQHVRNLEAKKILKVSGDGQRRRLHIKEIAAS